MEYNYYCVVVRDVYVNNHILHCDSDSFDCGIIDDRDIDFIFDGVLLEFKKNKVIKKLLDKNRLFITKKDKSMTLHRRMLFGLVLMEAKIELVLMK